MYGKLSVMMVVEVLEGPLDARSVTSRTRKVTLLTRWGLEVEEAEQVARDFVKVNFGDKLTGRIWAQWTPAPHDITL